MPTPLPNPPRVIIATRDPALCGALADALSRRGLSAHALATEREVLATLERLPRTVVIIDAQQLQMSGFELAREIRRQGGSPDRVGLIVLSEARWSSAQRVAGVNQLDLAGLIPTPGDPETLADLAHQTLLCLVPEAPPQLPRRDHEPPRNAASDLPPPRDHARPTVTTDPTDVRGSLTHTAFPVLWHRLYRQRATGALFLLRDTVKKIVYLDEGQLRAVKSNLLSECLGEVLVREGLISETQRKQSLGGATASGQHQGARLVELGALSPQDLAFGLQLQLRAKVMELFTWTRGEYLFKPQPRVPTETVSLELDTATLITLGIREHVSPDRLSAALASWQDLYLVPASDPAVRFQELGLELQEQEVVDSADGSRTLRQVLALTSLPRERALVVAYAAIATGVLEAREAPAGTMATEAGAPRTAKPLTRTGQPSSAAGGDHGRYHGPLDEVLRLEEVTAEAETPADGEPYAELHYEPLTDEAFFRAGLPQAHLLGPDHLAAEPTSAEPTLAEPTLAEPAAAEPVAAEPALSGSGPGAPTELGPSSPDTTGGDPAAALRDEALDLMIHGRWTEARARLADALTQTPSDGDLHALWGWCQFQVSPNERAGVHQAVTALRRASDLDPTLDRAPLLLGHVYAALGKPLLAERHYEEALQRNPACAEALTALRNLRFGRPGRTR